MDALVPVPPPLANRQSAPSADQHPAAVYLARLAPGSRRTMSQALDRIAALLTNGAADAISMPWASVRYQHAAAVRAGLAGDLAPATTNKHLAALRGVLKEAWRLGQMTAEDYHRASDLPVVRGATLPRGRQLSQGELRELFAACRTTSMRSARDTALLALAYGGGLRRAELVALDRSDFDPGSGAVSVRRAKGQNARIVYATHGSLAAIGNWIKVRGENDGPLLHPVSKSDRIIERRMTPQAVLDILRRLAGSAGISRFSPHDLRRTFISDLLEAGADIATVQQLAGHANIQTTARYDRRGDRARRKATELLHVPYEGPALR